MSLSALIKSNLIGRLGLYLKFSARTLLNLSGWKMMDHRNYFLDIKACNTIVKKKGRSQKGATPVAYLNR